MKTGLHIFLILCLAGIFSCVSESAAPKAELIEVGDVVPDFTVVDSDGDEVNFTTADFTGKKTLIVFFIPGCPDCQRELPKVQEAWIVLRENGFQLLTIGRSPTMSTEVTNYWNNTKNNKKIFDMPWYVEKSSDSAFYKFATKYVPRLYLIDETGKVVWKAVENLELLGIHNGDDLIAKINEFK